MDNVETLMAELRQAGEEPDQALLDRVKALGPAAVDPLIHMALDESLHYAEQESPEVWAPLHAIRLLGELQAPEAIGPLMELLSWDDDYLPELLPEAFGQIGRPAVVPLRALLFDRTQGVTTRSGAGTALSRIAKYHPDVRAEAVEALVARLDPAESQTPDDETLNGSIISDLLDIPAEEAVPAIQKAFDEDRVDQRMVTPEDVSDAFDPSAAPLPMRMDTPAELRLWLRCTTCGYSRPHRVPKVYYDLGAVDRRAREEETPYSDFIIPQRITCPRCGAVDQYELTGEAHLALTGELLRSMDGSRRTRESDSPLVPMRFTVADGREMHPLAALDMYRRQVAAEPDRADLRVRYGNVLRFLGYITEATDQYQAAVRLDPLQVEAYWNLGLFARDAGDRQEARSMFEHVLALAPQSRLTREEREEYLSEAREEIDNLESPRPRPSRPAGSLASPLPARRQGASAQLEPARLPRQTHKVGRNEPCPCGSGKKYKKCCGR